MERAHLYSYLLDTTLVHESLMAPMLNEFLHFMDDQRLEYVRRYYGENRLDPHLYDLMINSHNLSEASARLILLAMDAAG